MTPFEEITEFFKDFDIPEGKIKLPSGFMCDPQKLVPMHISILSANRGKYRFMPYYSRLHFIYHHFKSKQETKENDPHQDNED